VANELARQLQAQSPTNPELEDSGRQAFIENQLDDLESKIRETSLEINTLQDEVGSLYSARQIADNRSQIAALQQKLITLQGNYAGLLANTRGGAVNTLSVIETAALPRVPTGPNVQSTVLLAAAIGFVLSTGAAYLLEFVDDTIKTADDIARVSKLPTLAGIARVKDDGVGERPLIAALKPRSPISEAYRVLRTGIQFSAIDTSTNATILVTSANPGEGKSFTASNLAVVFAQAGNKVLLLDADLRRPTIHKIMGLSQLRGLTTLLLQIAQRRDDAEIDAAIDSVVQKSELPDLEVLTSGQIPPNPSELLGSDKMKMVLNHLRNRYDVVVIDSPPALAVTDSVVLSSLVSGVLLVVEAGKTRRTQIKQAEKQLADVGTGLLGFVLNRLEPGSDGYYYYYYYRSSYYTDPTAGADGEGRNGRGKRGRRRRNSDPKETEATPSAE